MPYKDPEKARAQRREYARKWRAANLEKCRTQARDRMRRTYQIPEVRAKRIADAKAWRANNKKKVAFWERRKKLRVKYGITPEQYERVLAKQNGTCALCHHPPKRIRLCVDHYHRTGEVRGLLCVGCNRALGMVETRMSLYDLFMYMDRASVPGLSEVA